MTRTRTWIAGTAVLAILISAAGWLLLINPQRSEAAELRDAAASQRSINASLQVRLEELMAKSADLPALQGRLESVRSRLPSQAELPELIRSLTQAASGAGMNLTGIVPAPPQLFAATAGTAQAAAAGTPQAATPAPEGDVAAGSAEQLYAINVSMTLTGRYAAVSSYINQLEELTRAFQVTGFTLGEDTSDGAPTGSVLLSVQGRVFVLSSLMPDVSLPEAIDPAVTSAPTGTPPAGTAPTVAPSAPAISY